MRSGVGIGGEDKDNGKASFRHSMTGNDRGEKASDMPTRKLRMRPRKLTSVEATEFLKTTIIPEIHFEDVTLEDALKIVDEKIAEQTTDDQPRPRILLDAEYREFLEQNKGAAPDDLIGSSSMHIIEELRLRRVPVNILLKYICEMSGVLFWIYKGDVYIGFINIEESSVTFYNEEKLSRVKLDNIDASQLSLKLGEIVDQHEYYGFKRGISIQTTEKARAAILKGEVQLPRINLDLENVTLKEASVKIAKHTGGALMLNHQGLVFNPFDEAPINEDPFADANTPSFQVALDENIFKPEADVLNQGLPLDE